MFLIYNYFMHILTLSVSDKMVFIVLLYKLLKVEYTGCRKLVNMKHFVLQKPEEFETHITVWEALISD